MQRLLVAVWSGVALLGVWFLYSSHRNSPSDLAVESEPSASQAARAPAATQAEFKSFTFSRSVRVQMGSKTLADLKMSGQLWVFKSLYLIEFDLPLELKSLSLMRAQINPSFQLTRLETSSQSSKADVAGRVVEDILQQYNFESSVDSQGRYEAQITQRDAHHFKKTKTRYLEGPYAGLQLGYSEHQMITNSDGTIKELLGSERIEFSQQQAELVIDLKYRFVAAPLPLAKNLTALQWQSVALQSKNTETAHEVFAMTPPISELLVRLEKGAGSEIYRDLVIRVDGGETLDQIPLKLTHSADRQKGVLIGALASSQRIEAQQILLNAYSNPKAAPETRELVMNAWTASDTPFSAETTEYLKSKISSDGSFSAEAHSAALALGAQIQKLQKVEDAGRRAELEVFLIAQLANASNADSRIAILEAMGNAGSPRFLPTLQDFISDPQDRVRARAYAALRLIPGGEVSRWIEIGKTDRAGVVRDAAKFAMSFRN